MPEPFLVSYLWFGGVKRMPKPTCTSLSAKALLLFFFFFFPLISNFTPGPLFLSLIFFDSLCFTYAWTGSLKMTDSIGLYPPWGIPGGGAPSHRVGGNGPYHPTTPPPPPTPQKKKKSH